MLVCFYSVLSPFTSVLDNMLLMPSSPPPARLYLILAAGVVAVSLAAIFIRYAQAPSLIVAAYRMTIASLILLPLTLPALRKTPLTKANAPYALLAGVFLGIHFATWISSLSFTTVAASAAIVATQPLWVALFSWLFSKNPAVVCHLAGYSRFDWWHGDDWFWGFFGRKSPLTR